MTRQFAPRPGGWLHPATRIFRIAATLAVLMFAAKIASAQAVAGITGTVMDTTGAVLPGARVTITNEATGVAVKTTTSSAGTYSTTGLLPGSYTVTVEATGFRKSEQTGVLVEASKTDTINTTLTAGSSTQTVEVTANAIALNTTQPQISSSIQPAIVDAMPIEVSGRGRQVDMLQFLAPGVNGSSFSHNVDGGVNFEEEIVYNGIPAPQPETEGYTLNFNPPWGLIQEATVERTTFAAQFGLGQGAYSYQTVSGTNHYHGDLFEINRNSFFDSDGFFNGPAWGGPSHPPTDHENNYGFDIGGPISIPHLYNGRDRTFGHYSQEWYKQNTENTGISTVPTAQEKMGNFNDFVNGSTGQLIPIYVPPGVTCGGLTPGEQFPGNIIPPSCISPTSAILIPYIPNPDRQGSGIGGLNSNKSFAPFINPIIQHVWGFTVDQVLTKTQSLHYAEWRNSYHEFSFDNAPLVVQPNPLNSMKYEPALGSIFLLDYSNSISPNLVMTAGFGWIGEINDQYNQTRYSFPAISGGIIPPYITWDGQHALTDWGTQGSWLQSINRKLGIAIVNNWLWTKGKNTFNIGQEFRRSYQDDNEEQTEGGQFAFSQRETSIPNPSDPNFGNYGSSFASFLLGIPDEANRSNSQELELRNIDYSPYIQDDMKLTRKLTVNLGLRWDIMVPFTENHNLIVFFNPSIPNPAASGLPGAVTKFGNCTGCAGYTRAPINWKHFGPRLGFAYELNNKTVVQGGYSVAFLDGGAYEYGTNKVAVNDSNLLTGSFAQSSSGTNVSSYGSWDNHIMPNPTATPFNPGLGVGGPQVEVFSPKDNYAPYAQMWNINVQRQLPSQMFITAAYVGTRDIHLPSQLNTINQIDPTHFSLGSDLGLVFTATGGPGSAQAAGYSVPYANYVSQWGGSATVAQSLTPYPQYNYLFNNFEGDGTTFYNALQVELDKRYSSGLALLASYTVAREYNNTPSGFTSFIGNALNRYNQKLEWAPTSNAPPQMFKVSGTYELPIGPGKRFFSNHGVTGQVLGGWQLGWIVDEEAGTPTGPGENLTFPYPNGGNRPNRNTSVGLSSVSYSTVANYYSGKTSVGQIWPQDAFSQTAPYTLGDAYRNYSGMKEPPFYNEDADVIKHFYFGDRWQGQLRVDYFNLFNRVQFNGPDTNFSDGTFGQVTSEGQQNSNRQGQVQFQVSF